MDILTTTSYSVSASYDSFHLRKDNQLENDFLSTAKELKDHLHYYIPNISTSHTNSYLMHFVKVFQQVSSMVKQVCAVSYTTLIMVLLFFITCFWMTLFNVQLLSCPF